MRLDWDEERLDVSAKALYVMLVVGPIASTKEVAPGVVVDFGPDGRVRGVEIFDAP